jgi:hypothetical protein
MTTSLNPDLARQCAGAHELGHAFAGREAGLTPERLVVGGFFHGGYCQFERAWVPCHLLWNAGVMLAAGQAGDRLYRREHQLGIADDERMFANLFVDQGDGSCHLTPSDGTWDQAVEEAETLLLRVWDELLPLVIPLAVHGRLDGI